MRNAAKDIQYRPATFDDIQYRPATFDDIQYRPATFDDIQYRSATFDDIQYRPATFDDIQYRPATFDDIQYRPATFDDIQYRPATFDEDYYANYIILSKMQYNTHCKRIAVNHISTFSISKNRHNMLDEFITNVENKVNVMGSSQVNGQIRKTLKLIIIQD